MHLIDRETDRQVRRFVRNVRLVNLFTLGARFGKPATFRFWCFNQSCHRYVMADNEAETLNVHLVPIQGKTGKKLSWEEHA